MTIRFGLGPTKIKVNGVDLSNFDEIARDVNARMAASLEDLYGSFEIKTRPSIPRWWGDHGGLVSTLLHLNRPWKREFCVKGVNECFCNVEEAEIVRG